jgi:hypothetical protein
MNRTKFKLPRDVSGEFQRDVRAHHNETGSDPRLVLGDPREMMQTTNMASDVVLSAELDDEFFARYPVWKQFVAN